MKVKLKLHHLLGTWVLGLVFLLPQSMSSPTPKPERWGLRLPAVLSIAQ